MPKNKLLETKFKGDYQAYKKYMQELGRKGGKVKKK